MSLLFSKITVIPSDGPEIVLNESGHPDESDMRELLRYEQRYAAVRKAVLDGALIRVQHYRFQAKGREWLAERDHLALMDAYDELAQAHGEKPFICRKDVQHMGGYTLTWRMQP